MYITYIYINTIIQMVLHNKWYYIHIYYRAYYLFSSNKNYNISPYYFID